MAFVVLMMRRTAGEKAKHGSTCAQFRRQRLALLPGGEVEAVAQQVYDTRLDERVREDGRDPLGKALQPVGDAGSWPFARA
jgi:hypothetical protein